MKYQILFGLLSTAVVGCSSSPDSSRAPAAAPAAKYSFKLSDDNAVPAQVAKKVVDPVKVFHENNIPLCLQNVAAECDATFEGSLSAQQQKAISRCGHFRSRKDNTEAELFLADGKLIIVNMSRSSVCKAAIVEIPAGFRELAFNKTRAWALGNDGKVYFVVTNQKQGQRLFEYQGVTKGKQVASIRTNVAMPGEDFVTFNFNNNTSSPRISAFTPPAETKLVPAKSTVRDVASAFK